MAAIRGHHQQMSRVVSDVKVKQLAARHEAEVAAIRGHHQQMSRVASDVKVKHMAARHEAEVVAARREQQAMYESKRGAGHMARANTDTESSK